MDTDKLRELEELRKHNLELREENRVLSKKCEDMKNQLQRSFDILGECDAIREKIMQQMKALKILVQAQMNYINVMDKSAGKYGN